MKKFILTFTLAAFSASMMMFTSCDKIKSNLFKAFSADGGSIDFTIPIISTVGTKGDVGSFADTFNIDKIIRDNTGGVFGLKDIKKIWVEEAKVLINNADADNNFANFEEGWLVFSTNNNMTPVAIATGPNPDVFNAEFNLPPVSGVNLKDYMTGDVFNYVMQAKMRRATTKVLNCTLKMKLRIE